MKWDVVRRSTTYLSLNSQAETRQERNRRDVCDERDYRKGKVMRQRADEGVKKVTDLDIYGWEIYWKTDAGGQEGRRKENAWRNIIGEVSSGKVAQWTLTIILRFRVCMSCARQKDAIWVLFQAKGRQRYPVLEESGVIWAIFQTLDSGN